jgi:parallel beta-helix repeat protein
MVHDTRQWQYNGEGIYIGTGSGGPLDNTSHVTVRNNLVFNVTDEGIELKPGTHDCLVEGNTLYNIMTDPDYAGGAGAIEINPGSVPCPNCPGGVQGWPSDPNHIIRNNTVHGSKTGIRAGTGCSVYNNVVYNIPEPYYGILANNQASDSYTRKIYHNTVDVPAGRAIIRSSGSADVKNNIGPSTTGNIASDPGFFVSTMSGNEDYHLVKSALPVDAGMSAGIDTDKDGNPRPQGTGYDMGAYEFIQPAGIADEKSPEGKVKIYPNPAEKELIFEDVSAAQLSMNAEIFNITGQKILDKSLESLTREVLDISYLLPGIYLIRISNETVSQNSRIIVAH